MAAFCFAVNFLCGLVIGILLESGYVSLIRECSTFERGKTVKVLLALEGELKVLAAIREILCLERMWFNTFPRLS